MQPAGVLVSWIIQPSQNIVGNIAKFFIDIFHPLQFSEDPSRRLTQVSGDEQNQWEIIVNIFSFTLRDSRHRLWLVAGAMLHL